MLQEVVSIHGPCPARSPAATFSAKASTTDVELASSGALAGTGAFQKLVDAKKRKGADRNGADSSDPPSTGVDSSDAPFSGPGGSAEVPVAAPDPETPGTEPDSEAPVAASDGRTGQALPRRLPAGVDTRGLSAVLGRSDLLTAAGECLARRCDDELLWAALRSEPFEGTILPERQERRHDELLRAARWFQPLLVAVVPVAQEGARRK